MISFILTKIIQNLILPPGIFIIFIVIFRNYKKLLLIVALFLYLFSMQIVAFKLLEPLEEPYRKTSTKEFDIVLLLSGGYIANAPNLSLSSSTLKRLLYAIEIAREQNIPIIFDGTKNEAFELKRTLEEFKRLNITILILNNNYKKEFGIYINNSALTTIDNAKNIKKFLDKNSLANAKLALVTSAFHMKRALDEFKRVNLNPTPMATDFRVSKGNIFIYYLPTSRGLELSSIALHEYLGLLRNLLFR